MTHKISFGIAPTTIPIPIPAVWRLAGIILGTIQPTRALSFSCLQWWWLLSPRRPVHSNYTIKQHTHSPRRNHQVLHSWAWFWQEQPCGAAVVSVDGMCPHFGASTNQNMFQHLFGIKFHFGNHTHVCGISPFKFDRCFGFVDNLTYHLCHLSCKFALDLAAPNHTSAWIIEQIHTYLVFMWDSKCEIFSPNKWAAPAASIQSFVNGSIGTQLKIPFLLGGGLHKQPCLLHQPIFGSKSGQNLLGNSVFIMCIVSHYVSHTLWLRTIYVDPTRADL